MHRYLRHWYMRTTSLSIPWAGSRSYVRFLYAFWSKIYDWTVGWDRAYRENARKMIESVLRQGDRVLDIGIGTGLLAEYGVSLASEYIGIDYSGAMLAQASKKIENRGWSNILLRRADAKSLPFADESFDAVVSSFVLPHFSKDERITVLREISRVLKPKGRIGLFLAQGEVAPVFPLKRELRTSLDKAGFTEITIEDRDDVYRIVIAIK